MTNTEFPKQLPLPMSVGNLINIAIQIYRAQFTLYLGWAMRAALWLVATFWLWSLMSLLIGAIASVTSDQIGLQVFLIVASIVIQLIIGSYCISRSIICGATISRLSYQTLLQSSETIQLAHQFVRARRRQLLSATTNVYFTFFMVYIGVGIIVSVVFYLIGNMFGVNFWSGQLGQTIVVIGIVLFLFSIYAALLFCFARLFVCDTILAVEDGVAVKKPDNMSWKLTQDNTLRIIAVVLTTGVIMMPSLLLLQVITHYIFLLYDGAFHYPSSDFIGFWFNFLLGLTVRILCIFVFLPLWKILQSTVYYDLKARKEGIDLQLI
ncbi:MAG: hypothetical protein F6J87_11425 [Spirulina sp. SIO3F2]|nr:hypothetical protein [Spirulina sp. SIO3F2]